MTLLRCLSGSAVRRALFAALACSLVGCGFTRPATVKQTYLLQAQPPAQATMTPRPATLKIGTVDVAAPFRGKVLVYRQTELKYEADFYNEFLVSPSAMLTEGVGAWLAAAKVFRDVLPAGANADGDYVLEGFVSELYGDDRDATQPAAVLTAKFFLIDRSTLTGVPVWQTEFKQRVTLSGRGTDALVAALNTAWAAMLGDLGRELAAAPLPAK